MELRGREINKNWTSFSFSKDRGPGRARGLEEWGGYWGVMFKKLRLVGWEL